MKKSLITLFAIPAFAISLCATACNKSAKNVTIFEAVALDTATGTWELEGQTITIEHLALTGKWGNHFFGGYAPSASTGDKPHIEAELKSIPTFKEAGDGYGADITLTGTLTDVDGRPVLKDATCKVNSERLNKKASDGHGLPIWYFRSFSRTQFDYNLDRTTCGTIIGDGNVFEIASMPNLTEDQWGVQEDVFYVVFPGENKDMEDFYNLSPIPVIIPEGLNDATKTKLKSTLSGKDVGGFIDLNSYVTYYSVEQGGVCILIEDLWGPSMKTPTKDPEVYEDFAALKAVYDAKFDQEIIDVFADDTVISFCPSEYITVKAAKEEFTSPAFIKIPSAQDTKSHMLRFNANVKITNENAQEFVDYVEKIADYLDDAETNGWENPENGVWTYKDDGENVSREIVLSYVETNPTYVDIMYFGLDKPAASPVIK